MVCCDRKIVYSVPVDYPKTKFALIIITLNENIVRSIKIENNDFPEFDRVKIRITKKN